MEQKQPQLIDREHEYPQLRDIMRITQLNKILGDHLHQMDMPGTVEIYNWRIKRVYYKPDDECRITLTAKFQSRTAQKERVQLFFGKLFPAKNGAQIYRTIDPDRLIPPPCGPAVTYIPVWDMILWAYPNDPDLTGLPILLDNDKVLHLARQSPEKFGLRRAPLALSARRVKYVPGKRCGFLFTMVLPGEGSHKRDRHSVFGKVYENDDGERAYSVMKQLWDSPARAGRKLLLPQPYSYDAPNRILWQGVVSGRPLAKYAGTLENLPKICQEIGSTLAALHNTPLPLPQQMTFEFQLWELDKAVNAVNQNYPRFTGRVNALNDRLRHGARKIAGGSLTTVHGSFKMSHIFETDGGIVLIDFDGANYGDPGYDVGRFLSHLMRMKVQKKIPAGLADAAFAHFCKAYNQAAGDPLSQERINWFTACHLLSSEMYKTVKRLDTAGADGILAEALGLCNW